MTDDATPCLLTDAEGPAAHVLNADGQGRVVLVCEHAARFIPASLGDLGLTDEARHSHAAWDIGAFEVARHMMQALDAPLVASRVSRLVYDCNRPPEAPDAIVQTSERFDAPGNRGLSASAREARIREVYEPFRTALAQTLSARSGPTILVTIHSFTPVYKGQPRAVELGLLHDADDRMAQAMLRIAPAHTALRTALNAPYDASDGVTHTLREHAITAGLPNVMIEIRNDLIDTPEGASEVAEVLVAMLNAVMDGLPDAGTRPMVRDAEG